MCEAFAVVTPQRRTALVSILAACLLIAVKLVAVALWRESLLVRAELTDRRGMAGCIERVAHALAAQGQFDAAAWFFGAAGFRLLKEMGVLKEVGN